MKKMIQFLSILSVIQFIVILTILHEMNARQVEMEKDVQQAFYLSQLKENNESSEEQEEDKNFVEQDTNQKMEQSISDYILYKYKKAANNVEVQATVNWENIQQLNDLNVQIEQNTSLLIKVHLEKGTFIENERIEIATSLKKLEGFSEIQTEVRLIEKK